MQNNKVNNNQNPTTEEVVLSEQLKEINAAEMSEKIRKEQNEKDYLTALKFNMQENQMARKEAEDAQIAQDQELAEQMQREEIEDAQLQEINDSQIQEIAPNDLPN